MTASLTIETPTGPLRITEAANAIVGVEWDRTGRFGGDATPLLREAAGQLADYFARRRQAFDLPLRPQGSAFQQAVWRYMQAIPYGETRTYGQAAEALHSMPRAVGTACGRNPVPVLIPCHRIVGAGGRMTGFSGGDGVETKRALLAIERNLLL